MSSGNFAHFSLFRSGGEIVNDNHNDNYQLENWRNMDVVARLKEFMDDEARSCSMDYGGVTPLYVYRMWGGQVPH